MGGPEVTGRRVDDGYGEALNEGNTMKASTAADARNIVLSILADFWEDATDDEGVDRLFDYWQHVRFEVANLPPNPAPELICEAFVDIYRDGGEINVDKATNDLATWPPIRTRIAELTAERAAEARRTKPLINLPDDFGKKEKMTWEA